MVALISKTEIQNKNIDMVEKAISFGALALRAALVGADNSTAKDRAVSIRVTPKKEFPSALDIDIFLPYDAYKFNVLGGSAIESLTELTSKSSSLESDLSLVSVSNPFALNMPDYSENDITTFEQYIYYYSLILWLSFEEKRNSVIKISTLGNQDTPQFWIDLSLPMGVIKSDVFDK